MSESGTVSRSSLTAVIYFGVLLKKKKACANYHIMIRGGYSNL